MALLVKPKTYIDNDPILYSDLNNNWDTLYNGINGNLDNTNIAPNAAIDPLKIAGGAVTLTTPQTVSGQKTLVKPLVNAVQVRSTYTPLPAATVTIDGSLSNVHIITMPAGNVTIAFANLSVGQFIKIDVVQDVTGGRTVTWPSGIIWQNSSVPLLTATGGKIDSFIIECTNVTGTPTYQGYVMGGNVG